MNEIDLTKKKCRICDTEKPLSEFNKNNGRKDGLQTQCRACEKAYYYANHERILARSRRWNAKHIAHKRKYRLENLGKHREYNRKQQGLPKPTRPTPGVCECCDQPPKKKGLALDHDHETGQFRGWLCTSCNIGLGMLGDSREGLERALAYIDLAAESN
jgi:hypothetical protein